VEFLLAIATERLRLHPADVDAILEQQTDIPLVDFLLALCKRKLGRKPSRDVEA
jgi:hypothetical protein